MPRQRPCCARRCARARARALLRMQLCSSVLLRSVVDLVPCRSHQLFAALLHGHARAEEATERSHRRSRRSPRSRLTPPPECHHHTLGLQEDTEGASRVREGLVVNNHNFLDEIESTFSDRESTLGLASGGRLQRNRKIACSVDRLLSGSPPRTAHVATSPAAAAAASRGPPRPSSKLTPASVRGAAAHPNAPLQLQPRAAPKLSGAAVIKPMASGGGSAAGVGKSLSRGAWKPIDCGSDSRVPVVAHCFLAPPSPRPARFLTNAMQRSPAARPSARAG